MHKTEKEGQIKTYSLRSSLNEFNTIELAVKLYTEKYNAISKWIATFMCKLTLGECAEIIEQKGCRYNSKGEENLYYKTCIEHKDEKMYRLFCKGVCGPNDASNILYIVTDGVDGYNGNPLGLTSTDFKRNGYFASVIANYKSKFANFKLKVSRKKIEEDSSFDDKVERLTYESINAKKAFNKAEDFDKLIEFIESNSNKDYSEYIKTIRILKAFFEENKDKIDQYIEKKTADELEKFMLAGCQRKSDTMSMTIVFATPLTFCQDEKNHNRLVLKINSGSGVEVPLLGHHKLLVDGKLLADPSTISKSVTFIVKNNHGRKSLFTNIQLTAPYEKPALQENLIPVGCDVNSKHILLATSMENPDSLKGYFNIYKELLKDKTLCDYLKHQGDLKEFKSLASFATFGMLEANSIFARYANFDKRLGCKDYDNQVMIAKRIDEILYRLLSEATDNRIKSYIGCTIKLRHQIQNSFFLKVSYIKYQKEYDNKIYETALESGLSEKDAIAVLRSNPFRNTPVGAEILAKRNRITEKINAYRDSIIEYAKKVMLDNGYNIIALENLDSSSFDKHKSLPSVNSLLSEHSHGYKGRTIGEILADEKESDLFNKRGDCYKFTFDENDRIVDAELSDKGKYLSYKDLFLNCLIKIVHFADVKDKFIELSNNDDLKVALVPAQMSSQMDSIEHKLYVEKTLNQKGKVYYKNVDKSEVRKEQEWHINGLNADLNSARNLAFYIQNNDWKESFLSVGIKKGSNGFGMPEFTSNKGFIQVKLTMEKMGYINVVRDTTDKVLPAKKSRKAKNSK